MLSPWGSDTITLTDFNDFVRTVGPLGSNKLESDHNLRAPTHNMITR